MKILAIVLSFILLLPFDTRADDMSDLKTAVQAVREKLVVLLVITDKNKKLAQIEEIKEVSQRIDNKLKTLQENKALSKEVQKNLVEFQTVWDAFRSTRDTQIVPYLLSGDKEKIIEAKRIARTIQAERFQKMQALLQ